MVKYYRKDEIVSMEMRPLISVIVPIYNVQKYLEKCIESIINQTYSNLEIILVNDGSPDESREICDKYEKKDSRIILINKKNGGLSSARNAGLKIAKGELVVCVDSDDWINEKMIETLYSNLEKYDADLSVCSFEIKDESGNAIQKEFSEKIEILNREQAMQYAILPEKYYGFAWNKMYRKSILKDMLYDETIRKGEDSPFTCEYISKCEKVVYQAIPLYYYRQDTVSITRSKFNPGKMTVLDAYYGIIKLLEKTGFSKETIDLQKVQYANQMLSLVINIINTDRKKYQNEVLKIRKLMKEYKKLYMLSQNIDYLHNIVFACGIWNDWFIVLFTKLRKSLKRSGE